MESMYHLPYLHDSQVLPYVLCYGQMHLLTIYKWLLLSPFSVKKYEIDSYFQTEIHQILKQAELSVKQP